MDRNREARRVAVATSNGLPRRRHRTSSLRDSPEDDGALELQEAVRFRDRTGKRDRDRDKERSERDRPERDRERDRLSRSKRRRGDKYMHGSNREDGVDDSSEESIDDEEEDPEDGPPLRFMPPNPVMVSSSSSPSSALTSHRKSYPPPSKVFKVVPTWKAADEMIGFTIPRKARSASTKRPHSAVVAEQFLQQIYSSPVRPPMAGSSTVASPSAAPMSPSSSSLSMKKKIKPNGPKQRPPKSSTQSPSSIQDDIEIEVAEVLYGLMRQSHGPSKQEDSARYDSREVNRSTGDSKSRASSPAAHSTSVPAQDSSGIPQNCNPSAPPLCAVAPKRKRPRLVSQLEENQACLASRSNLVSTAPKMAPDLLAKQEIHSQNPVKISDNHAENGGVTSDLVKSHGAELNREAVRLEPSCAVPSSEEQRLPVLDQSEGKDTVMAGKLKEVPSPKKEPLDDRVDYTSLQQSVSNLMITSTTAGEKEIRREEKLEIDLMAPPPQSRSPEREEVINQPLESMATYGEAEGKSKQSEGMEAGRAGAGVNTDLNTEAVEKGFSSSVSGAKEAEPHKANVNKARNIDLHLDLERSAAPSGGEDNKLNHHHHLQKQPPLQEMKSSRDDNSIDKTAQTSSIPLSMSVPAGWPAGLPPMGYVAPLQGMVSMDGRPMAPTAIQPPHFLFTQPRPGRCATHCYIAKNIFSHHQFMKNYPFWPAAAGASPLFSAKPYNLNLVPATELHASAAVRSDAHPVQDKGQTFAFFPGQQPAAKDKGSQPTTNVADGAQKKQLYQSLPPGAPNNMMHGPATLFFPMGQQQVAAAAASSHGKSTKSGPVQAGIAASASMSTAVHNASAPTGQASPATMSFTYPNVPANDTQYLAILANGGAYPFPVPTHVGAAQAYRGGAHPQVMPFYSSQYYPSQIIHPSQVQQHQQAPPPSSQPVQIQSSHQNPNISTASSSSQKHSQNQQQRPQGNNPNGVTTNPALQNFPIPKSRASQTQQQHEMGGEGSPSTADSRMSRPPPNMSVYGQSFAMPFNPSNFALMTSPATTGGSTNGSHSEKKQQQPHGQQQQQAMAPQAFAMSFASMNGATPPGLDLTSMEHNHAIFQSLPEAARNNYHIMAAAAAAQAVQQKKNYHGSGDGKSGAPGSSNADDERKGTGVKSSTALTGQSIAFSRPDLAETSVTTVTGNNVVDSSARSLNLVPGSVRSSRSSAPNAMSNSTSSGSQQQQQQQQQHQFIQLQRQQQYAAAAAAQNKGPVTSNGSVYSDHLSASSAVAAKFPNALSGFPPSIVQGNSPGQSQWKNSGRTLPSQGSSPSTTSNTTSMKSHGQQGRPQSGHTQISFGGNNTKPSTASQGQQIPNVTQSQSPPMMVGSPSTSSVSKGHSGSPRMTTSSSIGNNKQAQASSLSAQQGKNSPSIPSQKSSPVTGSGRNAPSVFGNSHMPVSSSVGSNKPQLQQPQLSKQSIQQAQMFFSSPYMQTSHSHPTSSSSAASSVGGFQLQRHRQEQQQQQPMPKSQGGPTPTASSGMLSLSPLPPANASTNDPTKAIKGGVFHAAQFVAQASGAAHTLVSAGFPYVHAVPAAAAVQVKPADQQKQPAGNDNMPGCWQPEKK